MHKPWYSFLYIKSPITKIALGIVAVLIAIVVLAVQWAMEEPRMAAQTANWEGRSIEKGAEIFANNCATCHGPDGRGGAGPALNSKYFFTQRLIDVGFAGTLEDYVKLTVAAGRPSKANSQWSVMMPTWSNRYGGPLRDDQVQQVTDYVLNWESTALQQTDEEDPWIPFQDVPSKAAAEGEAAAPAAGEEAAAEGPRPPQQIFQELGCMGCHNINEPQTDSSRGPIGPNLGNLNENAPNRVPGQDAVTYVHTSIAEPNAFVVPGYQPNLMPQGLTDRMTPEELDALIAWLLDPNRAQ
ncbi:MAG TPA: cytochrome c [Caldilineaceae bacterium]|nr:cytochrome c [Caldilineaceae bacterium]